MAPSPGPGPQGPAGRYWGSSQVTPGPSWLHHSPPPQPESQELRHQQCPPPPSSWGTQATADHPPYRALSSLQLTPAPAQLAGSPPQRGQKGPGRGCRKGVRGLGTCGLPQDTPRPTASPLRLQDGHWPRGGLAERPLRLPARLWAPTPAGEALLGASGPAARLGAPGFRRSAPPPRQPGPAEAHQGQPAGQPDPTQGRERDGGLQRRALASCHSGPINTENYISPLLLFGSQKYELSLPALAVSNNSSSPW